MSATVYAIYEAQRLGQIAPGVGRQWSLSVLDYADGEFYPSLLKMTARKFLDVQYTLYGPKELPDEFELPEKSFMPLKRAQKLPADEPRDAGG